MEVPLRLRGLDDAAAAAASIVGTIASLGTSSREAKNSAITCADFSWIPPSTAFTKLGVLATVAALRAGFLEPEDAVDLRVVGVRSDILK